MNMKRTHSPDFKNGSYFVDQGVAISAQGKFEMLQSSIYPEQYGVPCEYFFIIKLEFEPTEELKEDLILKQVVLNIKDRTRNKNTGQYEYIDVQINRPLPEKSENP